MFHSGVFRYFTYLSWLIIATYYFEKKPVIDVNSQWRVFAIVVLC